MDKIKRPPSAELVDRSSRTGSRGQEFFVDKEEAKRTRQIRGGSGQEGSGQEEAESSSQNGGLRFKLAQNLFNPPSLNRPVDRPTDRPVEKT